MPHLGDNVGEFSIGAKDEVPRSGSGIELCEGRIIRGERSLGAVELVDEELVEAEIVDHGEMVVGREVDGVRVGSLLALGIDSVAHRTTLEENGLTIAVLPTSLDKIYPSSHAGLARQIVDNGGTLISEYPVGQQALKFQFTARNRIVSGLADVVLITEAAVDSGTMTTARYALDQGKTVMVVPGNITSPSSEGCNNLIKSGALPVTEVSDILFALQLDPGKQTKRAFHGSDAEANVFRLIEQGITDQDELAEVTKLSGAELASLLSMLEINGYIRPAGNGRWLAS